MRRFFQLLCVLLILAVPASASAFPPTSTPTLPGIDVSVWQREIDWAAVKASGIQIAMIRSSVGFSTVDTYFERNYAGAKAAGISVGFYHFMTADTVAEALAQANFFISVIAGKEADCLLALDVGGGAGLSDEAVTAVAAAFLSHVEQETGLGVMLYTNASAARDRFQESLAIYPIWVANYGVEEPESNGKWDYWVGFQYSNTGSVNGINGHVDLNQFTKEVYQGPAPTVTVTPSTTPSMEPTMTPAPTPSGPTPTPDPEASFTYYQVKGDATAEELASRLGTTADVIDEYNTLPGGLARQGQLIRYPAAGDLSGTSFAGLHILQSKEALHTVARRYGTTTAELMALNGLTSSSVPVGQVLRVPSLAGHTAASPLWLVKDAVVVQTGQTVEGIAALYGTTAEELRSINHLAEGTAVYRGQILHLSAFEPVGEASFYCAYVVNRHDTLSRIARRFGVTVAAIAEWNNIDSPHWIYPGMVLIIP